MKHLSVRKEGTVACFSNNASFALVKKNHWMNNENKRH